MQTDCIPDDTSRNGMDKGEVLLMVDFEALLNKPHMTEEERQKLWDDWYNGLPESEKRIVDRVRLRDR